MIYRELPLPEPLHRIALCAWRFIVEPQDPPAFEHLIPPDGTTGLTLIRLPDGTARPTLVGPMLTAFTVPVAASCAYAGLRLRPEMARLVTGAAPQPGSFAVTPLDGRLAPIWEDLAELIEGSTDWSAALALADGTLPGDPAVTDAVDRLIVSGGTMPIARLAATTGLSDRQLRRRFHAATGLTPKQYADVQRVRRALILALDDPDWAGVAHDSGFADQPHLARDIKMRFGEAPTRVSGYFCGIRHELLEHGDVRFLQAAPPRAA